MRSEITLAWWFSFVLAAAAVFVANAVLARNAAVIARHARIGDVWVGPAFPPIPPRSQYLSASSPGPCS